MWSLVYVSATEVEISGSVQEEKNYFGENNL